jgi:peptidoglycan-associated lipoprotein
MRKFYIPLYVLVALSLAACSAKKTAVKEPSDTEKPPVEDTQKAAKATPDEPSLRGKEYQEVSQVQNIYFDLDQSSLRADARETLQKNYQEISKNSNWEVLVEGHCDQRGTTEYNLALGQRRAASVRAYYVGLGLSGGQIATISYGKESPSCDQPSEDCWSKNRRGVSKIRERNQ